MANRYVLDTHALLWSTQRDSRMGARAATVLTDPSGDPVLPATTLAEACWVVEIGRTAIPTAADLLKAVDADARITVAPLDRAVVERTLTLSGIREMHDRQIVATALRLTKGGDIPASGLVPVL